MIAAAAANDRAALLRADFDAQFAAAPAPAVATGERFLIVVAGRERLLLRLAHVAGLYVDHRIVAVPSAKPALLGIVGLRGAIVPVHGLGAALGFPPDEAPRWLVTAASAQLAFAVARFERYVEIARDRIVPRASAGPMREAAAVGTDTIAIVDLPSVAARH